MLQEDQKQPDPEKIQAIEVECTDCPKPRALFVAFPQYPNRVLVTSELIRACKESIPVSYTDTSKSVIVFEHDGSSSRAFPIDPVEGSERQPPSKLFENLTLFIQEKIDHRRALSPEEEEKLKVLKPSLPKCTVGTVKK